MSRNKKRCGNCGHWMERQSVSTVQWKDFKNLELLKPLQLLRCSSCGEVGLFASEFSLVDKAAEDTLQAVTAHLIEKILFEHHCSQAGLASRLGITDTHLSHLKSRTKTIGFQTFNFLKTLALGKDAFDKADPSVPLKQLMAG